MGCAHHNIVVDMHVQTHMHMPRNQAPIVRTEYKSGSDLTITPTGCTWTGPVRHEGSWGATSPTILTCELIIHRDENNRPSCAELLVGGHYEAEIGLEYDGNMLTGYDGVMSLPPQLAELLTREGITLDEYVI